MKTFFGNRQYTVDTIPTFKMEKKNAERFREGTIYYFKFIGFEFEKKHWWMNIILVVGICNMCLIIVGQVLFAALSDADFQVRSAGISYLNYFLVAIGKITALILNRKAILEVLQEFHQIYPTAEVEKAFNLQTYLKKYLLIENILAIFFQSISFLYNFCPFVLSVMALIKTDVFSYSSPLLVWYPFDIQNYWSIYILSYMLQVHSSYSVAIIILGLDLCMFSSLLQLCMHFDIINRKILMIEPKNTDKAEKCLIEQISYHQRILRLAAKVNRIFTPSVLFSLLSSSFIICFTGYQFLGEISIVLVVKGLFIAGYELKQVIITCLLGDMLINISVKVSDSIYEHKWYNGTPKYKNLVWMMLHRSQKEVALNIAGISNVSLQTFRKVMSISYQIFTILKTGQS